jgi:protein SCO1/2
VREEFEMKKSVGRLTFLAAAVALAVGAHSLSTRARELADASIYRLGDPWTNQDGKETPLKALSGKTQVVAMIYTRCKYACPLIVQKMRAIEDRLPKGNRNVGFALFSIDPEKDTPATLRAFAKAHHLNPKRWQLFTSNADAVRNLAVALHFNFKRDEAGGFAHQDVITVLDADGVMLKQARDMNQAVNALTPVVEEIR